MGLALLTKQLLRLINTEGQPTKQLILSSKNWLWVYCLSDVWQLHHKISDENNSIRLQRIGGLLHDHKSNLYY